MALNETQPRFGLSSEKACYTTAMDITPAPSVQPVSTKDVLRNFIREIPAADDSAAAVIKRRRLEYFNAAEGQHHRALQQLKACDDNRSGGRRLLGFFTSWRKEAVKPHRNERLSLAKHFFPPRCQTRVFVSDFGPNRAEKFEVPLGKLEDVMRAKPDWADVRWIHAPLGIGLTHSSVEALFFHGGTMGRDFDRAGRGGWPYLETEVLSFRSRENFQDLRDALRLLSKDVDITTGLDHNVWEGDENAKLRTDMEWRANHVGKTISYWDLASSDIPWQLSEGASLYMQGPYDGSHRMKLTVDDQSLSKHPFFEQAQFVRDPFRSFHRADGLLLTLSPAAGVDYLDRNLINFLKESPKSLIENTEASAIAHIYELFASTGTSNWHRKTVEWFLVYVFTELVGTPHNIRQGYNVPSIMSAYDNIVQDLKDRRFEPWRRNETVKLVRSFLACIDELTIISMIYGKKQDLLERLIEDCRNFEAEDEKAGKQPDNPDGETAEERVKFALHVVKEVHDHAKQLIVDLTESLNTLFQLRSVEQNELAIVADGKNSAIFVFTGVTIIFLPLSFFTSYYGMNFSDIQDTPTRSDYFWRVCGSTAFVIILLTIVFGLRHHLQSRISMPAKVRRFVA